jgi:DNA sulfur modification protein DndC
MSKDETSTVTPVFQEVAVEEVVDVLIARTQALYLEDEIPWVIGYSGGKDSTATVQLVWTAIAGLPIEKRSKPVHIISTDTLVENPIVALWVEHSLMAMRKAFADQGLPFFAHRLTPEVQDRFWVNLVGKGYPAPRPKFRWCTSRLKISPSNKFITDMVRQNGEAILVLGTRKAESSARHANMKRHEKSTREYLSKNADPSLDRVWVYTPIADWSNDDVWEYLVTVENPWGYANANLLGMYRGATKDNECPLVVDSSTPSCGDSRFGCYVCTMVDQDKSMAAMIQNDDEKAWMTPLLELRNKWLDTNDRQHRDFRRMNGALLIHNNRLVHGPYTQIYREQLLSEILNVQQEVRRLGPPEVRDLELLTLDDLEEIRRIWVVEKHEIEDRLPSIYEEATGQPYPVKNLDENQIFKPEDIALLREVCSAQGDSEGIHFQLLRELLHLEQQHRTMARRSGLFDSLDRSIQRGAFDSTSQAEEIALHREATMRAATSGADDALTDVQLELREVEPDAMEWR